MLAAAACVHQPARSPASPARLVVTPQSSGTTALLQAISPVSERIVWASGHRGTYLRTTDGGATWRAGVVAGADTLQFRDVHAVDADTAYLMSAGTGVLSTIYKTTDAGAHWTRQLVNPDSAGFFDCIDFWDSRRGVVYGDAVGGRLAIFSTEDGGAQWSRVAADGLPPALPNEGGFAASGTCVATRRGTGEGWIATGAAATARVLHTTDYGRHWTAVAAPVAGGEGAGLASVAFRDARHGAAFGGSIAKPDAMPDNVALSADGGRSWTLAARAPLPGAVYGGAYVVGAPTPMLVAANPKGLAFSANEGRSWSVVDSAAYWSVAFASPRAGWAVGPGGRIVRLELR